MLASRSMVRDIQWRLSIIGVPGYISSDMSKDIAKWVDNSGEEWVVTHLKSLKTDLIRQQANLSKLTWVRKNRNGKWFGWLGSLFSYALKSEKCFQKALQALMAYTSFVSPKTTLKQKEKFLKGVSSDITFIPKDLLVSLRLTAQNAIGPLKINLADVESLLTYRGSPSRRSPSFNGASVPQDSFIENDLECFTNLQGYRFYKRFSDIYSLTLKHLDKFRLELARQETDYAEEMFNDRWRQIPPIESPDNFIAGNVAMLQEPGFKCRSVASPFRIHQLATAPLGNQLYKVLKELPWDCTFDQQKALPVIQNALENEKVVHCVDLSAATDYFPLELQLEVLKELFGESIHIELFEFLSRSQWRSNELGPIRWTRGQPMGLYPSFASFGLTHGLILLMLSNGSYYNQFFVVGDDVVILDEGLATKYKRTLELLGCPTSPEKSISSNLIAEFAGKVITRNLIIPQLKWKNVSDENFLDLMVLIGQRARPLLKRRQRLVYDKISSLLPPLGCNHSNGSTLSLKDSVFKTEVFLDDIDKNKFRQESLVDLTPWLQNRYFLGQEKSKINKDYLSRSVTFRNLIKTFDEKVKRVFKKTPFGQAVNSDVAFAKGLSDLPEVFLGKGILPTPEFQPNRLSTLERYEKLLGITPDNLK